MLWAQPLKLNFISELLLHLAGLVLPAVGIASFCAHAWSLSGRRVPLCIRFSSMLLYAWTVEQLHKSFD